MHGRLFAAARGPGNDGGFRDVGCHGEAHTTEKLNAFGDIVDECILFFVVLIEDEMELVERVADDLPMMLLVEVAEGDSVSKDLIEVLDTGGADVFIKRDGEFGDLAVGLNLTRMLMKNRAGTLGAGLRITSSFLGHGGSLRGSKNIQG